jgi:hypothetical protein
VGVLSEHMLTGGLPHLSLAPSKEASKDAPADHRHHGRAGPMRPVAARLRAQVNKAPSRQPPARTPRGLPSTRRCATTLVASTYGQAQQVNELW